MHIITGEIRKEVKVIKGNTFIVELAESYKDRDGNRQYTNYKFFFSAKTDGLLNWYNDAFQVGRVISVSFDSARIVSDEYNGKTYTSIQPAGFPNLIFSQRAGGNQQAQQPQQNNQQQRPQQQQQSSSPANNQPPMDFDDDIPF